MFAGGPEFHFQNSYKKSRVLGRWMWASPLNLLAYLANFRPVGDPVSKDPSVFGSKGMKPKVAFWPAHTHRPHAQRWVSTESWSLLSNVFGGQQCSPFWSQMPCIHSMPLGLTFRRSQGLCVEQLFCSLQRKFYHIMGQLDCIERWSICFLGLYFLW